MKWELAGVLRKQEAKFSLTLESGRKVLEFEERGEGRTWSSRREGKHMRGAYSVIARYHPRLVIMVMPMFDLFLGQRADNSCVSL